MKPGGKRSERGWHVLLAATFATAAMGCDSINLPPPRVAFPWQGIAEVAGPAPLGQLQAPTTPLRGERGRAALTYPASFSVGLRPDGTVLFPQQTVGRLRANSIVVGSSPVATLDDAGRVSGSGLKRRYAFTEKGDLVDDAGRGVRLGTDGRVRALGGSVRNSDVMAWVPEVRGERWDYEGWRTMSIVSLMVLENLLPETVGLTTTTGAELPAAPAPAKAPRSRR